MAAVRALELLEYFQKIRSREKTEYQGFFDGRVNGCQSSWTPVIFGVAGY